jgi:hypothetical protein
VTQPNDDAQMDDSVQQDARIGYQVAVNLWVYEGQLIWSRFNAMVVANGIILTATSVLLSSERLDCKPVVGLSASGIILCLIWALMMARGFDYHEYWIRSARELEKGHLNPVKTVSRGGEFAEGQQVEFDLPEKWRRHQVGCMGRVPFARASFMSIAVFVIVYALAIAYCLTDWG